MEEFSFKPLSEGLGFYEKNPVGFDSSLKKWDWEDDQTYNHLLSLLEKTWLEESDDLKNKITDNISDNISLTLPANKKISDFSSKSTPSPATENNPAPSSEKPLPSSKKDGDSPSHPLKGPEPLVSLFSSEKRNTLSKNNVFKIRNTCFSLKSCFIDSFLVSLLFFPPFLSYVFLTEPDEIRILKSVWPNILFSFLFFTQIYCLLCRVFCFETFGEAFSKIRLSPSSLPPSSLSPVSQKVAPPFLLFWRFVLLCSTGFILLPLLSFILKKDLTARWTGLYFQKI